MMKRILTAALVICLLLTTPAFAAPARELSQQAKDSAELIAQVQPLCNAVAAGAFRYPVQTLRNESAPDAGLVLAVLQEALGSHLLVEEAVEGKVSLSQQEAQSLARQLFYNKELPELTPPEELGVLQEDGQLVFDLNLHPDFMGVHIYDLSLTEEELLIKADFFTSGSIQASAVDVPEDSLVWLGHIGLRLKPDADAAVGFTLASFSVPEVYMPAQWIPFQGGNRFELLYPNAMTEQEVQGNTLFHATSGDHTIQLRVVEEEGSLEGLLEAWRKQAEDSQGADTAYMEDGRLYYYGPSTFRLAYADPQGGRDACLVLELTFPPQLEHEFTLYQTFLNNSFVVYSHSHG